MAWAMKLGTCASFALLLATVPACSSDEASDSGPAGGSGGAGAQGGTAGSGSGGTSGSGGSGGSGACSGDTTLQNDAFTDNAQVGFQGGFLAGECFASVFTPAPGCDLELRSALALIGGGGDAGTVDFVVKVHDVDGAGVPAAELATTQVTLTNQNDVINQVPLDGLALPARSTPFALSFCHVTAAPPSIARDDDGIEAGKNFIYGTFTSGGAAEWRAADAVGVQGDWVLRAKGQKQ